MVVAEVFRLGDTQSINSPIDLLDGASWTLDDVALDGATWTFDDTHFECRVVWWKE